MEKSWKCSLKKNLEVKNWIRIENHEFSYVRRSLPGIYNVFWVMDDEDQVFVQLLVHSSCDVHAMVDFMLERAPEFQPRVPIFDFEDWAGNYFDEPNVKKTRCDVPFTIFEWAEPDHTGAYAWGIAVVRPDIAEKDLVAFTFFKKRSDFSRKNPSTLMNAAKTATRRNCEKSSIEKLPVPKIIRDFLRDDEVN